MEEGALMRAGDARSQRALKVVWGAHSFGEAGEAILTTESGRDRQYMARALELASRGRGFTSPNPIVGAVLVRDGEVVGEGYHERFGAAHAEARALAAAGARARGATLYVTLEPCCVWGKTPPCTDAIVSAGVARVVVAALDPNPAVSGRGVQALKSAGLAVEIDVLRGEAEAVNAPYLKFRRTGLPHVLLKMAMSLDGRVAGRDGRRHWMTCEASRELVHAMRGESDCVMVGIGTVLADDPLLTDRRPGVRARQPARLILDRRLRTPLGAALVRTAREHTTVVACGTGVDGEKVAEIESAGVAVWRCPEGKGGLDLAAVLARAAEAGMLSVLCEGGPEVAASLMRAGLVDRVAFFIAPRLSGTDGLAALGSLSALPGGDGPGFGDAGWRVVGTDVLFEGAIVGTPERAPAPPGRDLNEGGQCSQGSSRRQGGSSV
jgi:diaminohydroxyphosphoribosylaminopyrimidine deaminase/5-amino-6-(5-phosphoribosylamino)uracil reductase